MNKWVLIPDCIPMLEASSEVISSLVSLLCIDSSGYSLSKETIKTYLQPSEVDKRPKSDRK